MSNFYYNPGVVDHRGEYFNQAITQGFESLAAGIEKAQAKHKENKAYSQLAETLGLDPKHSTKQDVQAAMLKNEILQSRADQQRQQSARAGMARLMQGFNNLRQGGPDVNAVLAQGRGPIANPPMQPPMSPGDALATSLAANPEVLADDKTTTTAGNLAKLISSMGQDGVSVDPGTGLPLLRNGNNTRVINPAWLRQPPDPNTARKIDLPDGGGSVFRIGNTDVNPRDVIGNDSIPQTGKFPKGAKITQQDGKDVVVYQDGSFTPISNPPANTQNAFDQIENAARGGTAAPAKSSTDENFSKGDRVEQNGVTYEYDGENWNPLNE